MATLRSLDIPAGPDVLRVLPTLRAMLAGDVALLPVPAFDAREKLSLTTALRVDSAVDDDVALVVSTSGTTGVPKGAMLTSTALTASAAATHARLGGPGRWLLALPAHHIAGMQVLIRSVLAGTTPVVMNVSGGFDVPALPDAVAAMGRGRRYASLVAAQLAKALAATDATAALASLDAVLLGGGPLPAVVAEKASAAGIPVVRTYGMSETAGGCVYDGVPLDGVRVRIDDGRVVIGGATLAKGYRNPVVPDPFAEPGWFFTDDAGSINGHGVLRVYGRLDEAISTGGLTVLPQLVEAAMADHPGVASCAVFGVPDDRLGQRVAVVVVAAPGVAPPTLEELRARVGRSLNLTAAPRELHIVDQLPLRGIGKVDRRALAQRFGSHRH
ncbi:MAG: o-succinylbenzoate--CoA ligase [Mycolicibacterium sp.]|nr:o-succinylbenzoate--CoA ligase [Mycolicibacterium sp.]